MSRRGRLEGSIYQRGNGRWVGTLDLGWEDGKRKRKSVYGPSRQAVRDKLQTVQQSIAGGLAPAPERLTVGGYLADWLEAAKPTIRPATFESYATITKLHLVPALGRIALGKLTVADVERLLRSKTAAGLSPRRVAMIRAVLRRALSRAVKHRTVSANVAALADPPKQEGHEIRPLDPAEARSFLESIRGHRFEALFVTALTTGLRSGELRGLTWDAVDLEARTLTVRWALQRIDGKWRLVEPKSQAGRRVVPLPDRTVAVLRAHRTAQREARLLMGPDWLGSELGSLVFTTSLGTELDASGVTHSFQDALERAGLRRQRFHDLRHGAATYALASGVPARVVADMLGHSNVSMTLSVYSHVLPELRRDAADRMDRLLEG